MKIRFCENNKGKGKVVKRLKQEYPDLDIKVKDCVKECGTCGEKPLALVDKIKVSGRDGESLYLKIVEAIKKRQQ